MTHYLAITTANEQIWEAHGRVMAETFVRYWPRDVILCVYCENFSIPSDPDGRLYVLDLEADAPWLCLFKALYRDPRYNGGPGGRDYRHDAVRFAHKVAAIGAAAEDADCDVLIWMDADTVTHASVTREWLDSLFPESAVVAWLDRERTYPECSFLFLRMPEAQRIIRSLVKLYRTGGLFKLPEWHDSFAIQHVVQSAQVRVHSLSGPQGRKHIGHPFVSSPLAACMDHLKGETRKAYGRSLPQDLRVPRPEPYWRAGR